MNNDEMRDELSRDIKNSRGALREIIDHSRLINQNLFEELKSGDFTRIEELNMLQEGILKSVKLLAEINQSQPKTIKEIDSIQGKAEKINLSDLIED